MEKSYGEAFARALGGLTAYQAVAIVAKKTGTEKSRWRTIIYRWVRGTRIPRLDTAVTIARALDIDIESVIPHCKALG